MKIILAMVMSVDGHITKGDENNIYTWTSKEDQEYFHNLIQENNLIVMGSQTYEAVRPAPQKERLRIVFTRNPEKYKASRVSGQLEFTSENPRELVDRLGKQGFSQMLLVGGPTINTIFFQENLINELWLTIEPKIFGEGKMLVKNETLDVRLQLISVEKINVQGTLLTKYAIVI